MASTATLQGSRGVDDWPSHFGAMGHEYEHHAFGGAALAEQGRRELEIVLAALGHGHGRSVLDIGAGTGRFTCALTELGWKVTALDGAQQMLDCIAERAPDATRVLGRLGDPFSFDDAAFDAVVAMRVLKYVPRTGAAIREMTRVVKVGGSVVFDVANRRSLARFGYADSPMGFVTPESILQIANTAGLEIRSSHDGFRLPHAVVGRAESPLMARGVGLIESGLARLAGPGTGRGARSIIFEARRTD